MGLPRSVKPRVGMTPSEWMRGYWRKASLGRRVRVGGNISTAGRKVYKTQTAKRLRRQDREAIAEQMEDES